MKSVIYALAALMIYGSVGVIIEQKLESFNTIALTFLFTLPFIPLALLFLAGEKLNNQTIAWPEGNMLWLVLAMGCLYFLADYFYIGAFTAGGDVITIATILMLGPVVAALTKYLWIGGSPNTYQVLGYLFAVVTLLLMAKGATQTIPR